MAVTPVAIEGNGAASASPAVSPQTSAARQSSRTGWMGKVERLLGLTVTGIGVGAVAFIGWMAAYKFGGKALYILAYCAAIALGVAVVIARRRRKLDARRSELPRRMREGQSADVELSLSASRRANSFVIEERMSPWLGGTVRVPVAMLGPGRDLEHRYELRPILRGVYQVGPLFAEWTDPLGLARHEQLLLEPSEVLVHPNVEQIFDRPLTRMWEDPPIRPPISKRWPQGFEFYGMRDYVRGDDLRRVVWRAVARTGRMLVRESEQGITDKVTVLIDTNAERHSPGLPSDTFELAVRVAASAGALHIKDGFSVSLHSNEQELARNLRGPRARIMYLDELARLQPGKDPLSGGIERLLLGQRDIHVILITPFFGPKSAARLRMLIDLGVSVLLASIVWEQSDPNSARRAQEIGAQVVQVSPGVPLATVFAHSLGAGIR